MLAKLPLAEQPLDCTLFYHFIGREIQTRYITEIIAKLKENYNFTDVSFRGGPNIII